MKLLNIISYKTVPSSPSIPQYEHEDRKVGTQDSLLMPVTFSLHVGATIPSDQTAERGCDENLLHLRSKCECESTRQSSRHHARLSGVIIYYVTAECCCIKQLGCRVMPSGQISYFPRISQVLTLCAVILKALLALFDNDKLSSGTLIYFSKVNSVSIHIQFSYFTFLVAR